MITRAELGDLIRQCEEANLPGGVVMMPRPRRPYRRDRIHIAPNVWGRESGGRGADIFVCVELAGLRRVLALMDLLAGVQVREEGSA